LHLTPVFDLDGTLIDSDAALNAPFAALGIDPSRVPMGLLLDDACAEFGVQVDDYLARYDDTLAMPFAGVEELVAGLDEWAIFSNKKGGSGRAELARLGWQPDVVMFADDFDGPKQLTPVLDALGCRPDEVIVVGDTEHDRRCALSAGGRFALAGWNPRASAVAGDVVLRRPLDLLGFLDGRR
jgi:phosphoglycolate phosphatase-like HAD superfamily hydrolase